MRATVALSAARISGGSTSSVNLFASEAGGDNDYSYINAGTGVSVEVTADVTVEGVTSSYTASTTLDAGDHHHFVVNYNSDEQGFTTSFIGWGEATTHELGN